MKTVLTIAGALFVALFFLVPSENQTRKALKPTTTLKPIVKPVMHVVHEKIDDGGITITGNATYSIE